MTLQGSAGDDYLVSTEASETIDGGAGNDIAAFVLPAGTLGALSVVEGTGEDEGKLLVILTDNGIDQLIARITPGTGGNAIVEGVNAGSIFGTDTVTSIESIHFVVEDSTDEAQFAFVALAPEQYGDYVAGSAASETIDLADYPGALSAEGNGGDDSITGNDGGNYITGGAGTDSLSGGIGDDNLQGGDGDDSLQGGADNDYMVGGAGDDTIDGGTGGNDIAAYTLTASTTAILRTVPGDTADTIIVELVEGETVEQVFRITFTGNGAAVVEGLNSAAYLGTDTVANAQLHILVDGTSDYENQFVAVDLPLGAPFTGGDGADFHFGIAADEVVSGKGGDDFLLGGGGDDRVDGGAGDDIVRGDAGDDVIYGGDGDDLLRGGAGVDYFDGGADSGAVSPATGTYGDRITFFEQSATQGVIADLRTGIISNDGFGNVEYMVGIESLGGDTVFADQFYGDDARNDLLSSVGDTMMGFGGDDFLQSSGAGALVDGGDGIDFLQLSSAGYLVPGDNGFAQPGPAMTAGWYVNLALGTVTDGFGDTGSIANIENVGGTPNNDTIEGDAGDNEISGWGGSDYLRGDAGDDTLSGGDGDDYLIGNSGNDILDGGAGWDRAGFSSGATAGVTVDLNIQGVAQDTGQGFDTLIGIEQLSGTRFDDVLTGDGGDNWLWGGSDGSGVTGNDQISAGGGNDLVSVGAGNHILDGGDGIDTLELDGNTTDITADGVTVSLALQGAAQDTEQGSMTLTGFENISGSLYDDLLTGDSGANVLAGSAGNDTLAGGSGDDTLLGDGTIDVDTAGTGNAGPVVTTNDADGHGDDVLEGGAGNDTLIGGGGSDTASYANAAGGVEVRLYLQRAYGADGNDILDSIENVIGSAYGDLIFGDDQANDIAGGAGNDTLIGLGGDDVIGGGAGFDYLEGGAGADILTGGDDGDYLYGNAGDDILDGGAGWDRVGFSFGATAGVTVDLNLQGVAQDTGQGFDTLISIEQVSGTRFDDVLTGDGGDNWLWGGSDGSGVTGNDQISAGGGDDLVSVGTGNHILDGGEGIDTVELDGNNTDITAAGVTVSLALQGSAQDTEQGSMTLTGFENLSGSNYADQLTGDAGDNVLAGGAGADLLIGGAGNDTLLGDGVIDVDTGGTGNAGLVVTFEDIGANADDLLQGGEGSDTLKGGGGDDVLEGQAGDDLIEGGGGIDSAAFVLPSDVGGTLQVVQGTGSQSGLLLVQRVSGGVAETLFEVGIANSVATVTGVNSAADYGTDEVRSTEGLRFSIGAGSSAAGTLVEIEVPAPYKPEGSGPVLIKAAAGVEKDSPVISSLADGNWIMVWTEETEVAPGTFESAIKSQLFAASGQKIGGETLVADGPAVDAESLSVAGLAAGGHVVVWEANATPEGEDDVYAQVYDAAGAAVGAPFAVNQNGAGQQDGCRVAALAGGGFVVTWTDDSQGVWARFYSDAGVPAGDEFQVSDAGSNFIDTASVAALPGGGFVATWEVFSSVGLGSEVKARIVAADGSLVGEEFTVQSNYAELQTEPVVTVLESGAFVVAWTAIVVTGDVFTPYLLGQMFAADGSRMGDEFIVSDAPGVADPLIVATEGGGFVVGWVQGENDSVLKAQAYGADGARVGGEFFVTESNGDLDDPAIAAFGDGFIVAWEAEDAAGESIAARIFNNAGNHEVAGVVLDGYVSGATVFIDVNGNGKLDQGEPFTTTAEDGTYTLVSGAVGPLVVTGGTNTDTGLPNLVTLKAPPGATVINPLTTVMQVLVEQGAATSADAEDQLKASLGLDPDLDLLATDIYAASATDPQALAAQKAAVSIVNILVLGGDVSGGEDGADLAVYEQLGTLVGSGSVDLSDAATLGGLYSSAFPQAQNVEVVAGDVAGKNATVASAATTGEVSAAQAESLLSGNSLDNNLSGGKANDSIKGFGGNDRIAPGRGADTVDGGTGTDTLVIDYGFATTSVAMTAPEAVVDNGFGGSVANGEGDSVAYSGIERFEVRGGAADDTLRGADGDDLLDGGAGADTMEGGAGNDVYVVDDGGLAGEGGDQVVEGSDGGIDEVRTGASEYRLAANVENLTGTSAGAQSLTGNGLANVLVAAAGADRLDGGLGADTMRGGAGDDTYVVDNEADQAVELAGNGIDTVESSVGYTLGANLEELILTGSKAIGGTGNEAANVLTGNAAANKLDGKGGADTMAGGGGNDTYVVDNVRDKTIEFAGKGRDLVTSSVTYTLAAHVENLTLTGSAAIRGTGNAEANRIVGNGGGNVLSGKGGADTLIGAGGNDTLLGDGGADRLEGGYGKDVLRGGNGTDVLLGGAEADKLYGEAEADRLEGNGGADLMRGGGGMDVLNGGGGNDVMFGDGGNDVLNGGLGADELTGGDGNDLLQGAGGSDKLFGNGGSDELAGNGGNDSADGGGGADTVKGGGGNDHLIGGKGTDKLYGDEGADTLEGGSEADLLDGGTGPDVLKGGGGADTLIGGAGPDLLEGGAGKDGFYFTTKPVAAKADTILDFSRVDDTIYLDVDAFKQIGIGTLAASAFHVGKSAGDADDRIVYNQANGKIFYDADGSGSGAAILFAQVTPGTVLTNADFVGVI